MTRAWFTLRMALRIKFFWVSVNGSAPMEDSNVVADVVDLFLGLWKDPSGWSKVHWKRPTSKGMWRNLKIFLSAEES